MNNVGYNQENGIHILGAETSGNLVLGCTIQQNALDGVRIENSPGNSIGGTGAGNGISGNGSGVEITGAAATCAGRAARDPSCLWTSQWSESARVGEDSEPIRSQPQY